MRHSTFVFSLLIAAASSACNYSGQPCEIEAVRSISRSPLVEHALGAKLPPHSTARFSNLYELPEPINIEGYKDSAMEPCISCDGQYLFFNNSNEESADTHIHFAKRLSENCFSYQGILVGTRSSKKDMAPSLDRSDQMYFTSLRSFDVDHKSLYSGLWHVNEVKEVAALDGNISPTKPFLINMDSCVSPDGNILFISRAQFFPFEHVPRQSDLIVATRDNNGKFQLAPKLQDFLNLVNTSALEYAPAITEDLRELYFTRCHLGKNGRETYFETMVARRNSVDKPFDLPERLSAIEGYSEAPSITLNKQELYYHKLCGGAFRIFRVTRKSGS